MIICLSGTVGGGKTLSAVADMCKALRSGRVIVGSNIWLKDEAIRLIGDKNWRSRYVHLQIGEGEPNDDPNTWPVGDKRGSGGAIRSLIVIDEAAEWLDAILGRDARVERICSWLRHSDKLGCDVVLVVQHWSLLHRRARALVAEYRWAMDLAKTIIPGTGIKVPFGFNRFILVKRLDRDAKTSLAKPEFYVKDKEIFAAYDTAAMYGASWNTTGTKIGIENIPPDDAWFYWLMGVCAICSMF